MNGLSVLEGPSVKLGLLPNLTVIMGWVGSGIEANDNDNGSLDKFYQNGEY